MKLNRDKIDEIKRWSQTKVQTAEKKSRTILSMKKMWQRIQEWAVISENQDIASWKAQEAMQVIQYIEMKNREERASYEFATWSAQNTSLSVFQKTMLDKGFLNWVPEGPVHKLAKTTLGQIITQESKTEISKHRITKKQSGDLKDFEVVKVAAWLYMRSKDKGSYELNRKMQYVTWVFTNNCGMRLGDVLRMQWDQTNVDEKGQLSQRIHYSKSDRSGRKRDEIVIHNRFSFPADLKTAYKVCLQIKHGLKNETNLMFPKSTDIKVAADAGTMTKGWKEAAAALNLETKLGARVPKTSFLNSSYKQGTPSKLIHKAANWGKKSTDIRSMYVKSESGEVRNDE